MAASSGPTMVQESQLGCLLFDFTPPCAFNFDQKVSWNIAQIIPYYHVTKQLLCCLNWLVTCFRFQNMFWKNINCFRFWWKTCTKHFTSNCVISRFKRFSFPALCEWSGAFNFRVWFEKWKQKYCIKNMVAKILILILFCLFYFADLKTIYFMSCLHCSCKLF